LYVAAIATATNPGSTTPGQQLDDARQESARPATGPNHCCWPTAPIETPRSACCFRSLTSNTPDNRPRWPRLRPQMGVCPSPPARGRPCQRRHLFRFLLVRTRTHTGPVALTVRLNSRPPPASAHSEDVPHAATPNHGLKPGDSTYPGHGHQPSRCYVEGHYNDTQTQYVIAARLPPGRCGGSYDGSWSELNVYIPILVLGAIAAAFAVGSVAIASLVGPSRYNKSKMAAYECGIEPTETSVSGPHATAGQRFPVKYYLTAMLFIVFDIEIVFLYPWAGQLRRARGRSRWSRWWCSCSRCSWPTPTCGAAAA
jgi:NADH-quinone oxidoreductase subunit A